MFKHYFKTAVRNLGKSKVFSFINILGLTIGLTCCILMVLYIRHELSYDDFQKKGDRITRVIMEYSMGGSVMSGNFTSTKVAPAFKKNFPEVEQAVRMTNSNRIIHYDDKLFDEKSFMYADSTFFDIFSFKLLKGNPQYALSGPNVVVVTQSTSKKYFGNDDPVGKIIKVGSDETPYQVTGVIEDCPSNSQIKYDMLASFSSLGETQEETYWNANFTTYLLLKDKKDIASLQAKIPAFMKKEMAAVLSGNDYVTFNLEPFRSIHLHSPYEGFEPNSSITYIYIIGIVALLILAIACFTYVNLSTARSMERAKEVGIRKVSGAHKKQIFWQFIGESMILSVISLLLSFGLAALLLPSFNQLADRQLDLYSMFSPFIIGLAILIIICISLFAGSYPALILSGFQPVKVLKGAFKNTGSGLLLRKTLIVFQFAISAFLIVATFIIQNQLHFIQNKDLGFDREHIVVLPLDQKMRDNLNTIKTEFKTNPDVLSLAKASNEPINIISGFNMRRADQADKENISVNANVVDEDFIKTIGAKIIEGTDFTLQDSKDVLDAKEDDKVTYHFILNESAAKALGWTPEEAIGKKMYLGDQRPGLVKAVVKDFNFSSFHDPIKPLVLFNEGWGGNLLVKLSGKHLPQTLAFLESKWKELVPQRPFEYRFLDDDYNKLYQSEIRLGKVLNIFATIAILLAALGLFGLSAYTIQQRTKEIGIRKVLGASVPNVITLLSKDFLTLVIIASLIAFPIAWWAMNKWLEDFVYRVSIGWWIFLISGIIAVVISLLTVSFLAVKAAVANPVKSLRTE
ncbi:MAG: ABC transporter permease [Bacteroidetes bacterium]|nr:ABC transporter permease [Bacteroidota bacterium]MBS1634008.1 ABC transporter permease [Bacteroidota bacterium]